MRALVTALLAIAALGAQAPVRWLDLDGDVGRQVTVHRDPRKYLGHPTTLLLPDGHTILCVHPEGHGRGSIVLQRSTDAGRTWSEPLPVPASWATSLETPTIHRLVDPRDQRARLVLFSGLFPIRSSISTDDGATWTELAPIGPPDAPFGGIVAMASVVSLANGECAAFFHDDGRYFHDGGKRTQFTVYQTRSGDGGQTWGAPSEVWSGADLDLCEPGVVRSPDGRRLAMLLRENSRRCGSHVMLSADEAVTWSPPAELPRAVTGDRHVGTYAPDGRLLLSFRDMATGSPTRGDWVAWVGTFDDLEQRREGQYRVRLSRNWRGTDCGYPGVEVLADGTFVLTTYGHWEPGEAPFVRSVRVSLAGLDELARGPSPVLTREPGTVHATARAIGWWSARAAEDLEVARRGGIRLVMLGDSITEGWRRDGAEVWQRTFATRAAFNAGVSGDRTQNVLWRLDHGLGDALAAANNDVRGVVVMIGTNNSNGAECTAEEIAMGIAAVVQRVRHALPRAKVLLLAIFPRGAAPGPQRDKNARASALAAAQFASDPQVVCRDIGARFLRDDGVLDKAVMPDLLHLSPQAYATWADAMLADVDRLLQ